MEKTERTERTILTGDKDNDALIKQALRKFQVPGNQVEFIRHNENLTVKVEGKYLLRVHKPAASFQTIHPYANIDVRKMREEELAFLRHLRQNGMGVQDPVPDADGGFVAEVDNGIYATMLRWIPGRTIGKEELNPQMCQAIGEMTARIRKAAGGFHAENALQYDAELCETLKTRFAEDGCGLEEKTRQLLLRTCDCIGERVAGRRDFMTAHADLSLSNILITEQGLVPIDFSLFGCAHPMMDIAGLFACVNGVENRRAIAKGYASLGYGIDFPILDAYFAFSVLLYVVLHIRLCGEESFQKNLDRWSRHIFQPLAEGKPLISEDFYMLHADA